MRDIANVFVAAGIAAFPCLSSKSPACAGGFHAASLTPDDFTWLVDGLVGVPIPEGIIVIDSDTYKGMTTDKIERALGVALDWDAAFIQHTRSGGAHYAFSCDEVDTLMQGANLFAEEIGEGLDTRTPSRGYICTGGPGYSDGISGGVIKLSPYLRGILPALPQAAVEKLRAHVLPPVAPMPANIPSIEIIESALAALPPEHARDRDSWIRTGMALKRDLGESGWLLWLAFSKTCPDKFHGEASTRKQWDSFKREAGNTVTIASILHAARAAGWNETQFMGFGVGAAATMQPVPRVMLVPASTITPLPVSWLWDGWLARGKLAILAGAPGTGKTTISMSIAATISTGGNWPDGSAASVGNTLIWSGEDAPNDTLVPRLIAAGADLSRCFFVEGPSGTSFDPARDMSDLEFAANTLGDVSLLIVDPIVSAVTGDSHKAAEVRRSLQPVVDFAERIAAGIIGITHLAKGTTGRDPLERVIGSQAFGALARLVLVAAKDQTGADSIITRVKSNIGPTGDGYRYTFDQVNIGDGIHASRARWGERIEGSARTLLGDADSVEQSQGCSPAVNDGIHFLETVLANGPIPVKSVKEEADGAGISERTLLRACQNLKIKREKVGGAWFWQLANPSAVWQVGDLDR